MDAYQNTSQSGVYALGDVTGKFPLTPVAIKAARLLSDRIFGNKNAFLDYSNIPSVIFTHPPVATIGLGEEEARLKYKNNVKVFQTKFKNMFYAFTDEPPMTTMKIITKGKKEKIIGIHLVGRGVDEIIQGFSVSVKLGSTRKDFNNTVAIHPTASEELVLL